MRLVWACVLVQAEEFEKAERLKELGGGAPGGPQPSQGVDDDDDDEDDDSDSEDSSEEETDEEVGRGARGVLWPDKD